MSEIGDQIEKLPIPYPQKKHLKLEVDADPRSLAEGTSFQKEDLHELFELHNNPAFKLLNSLQPRLKNQIETAVAVTPLAIVSITFGKENFMIEFFKEGGPGMLAILALSIPLFYRECMNLLRLIVVKDHSRKNLNIDSTTVHTGCLAMIFVGFAGTALGIYYTTNAIIASPENQGLLIVGIKESLGNLIMSSAIAGLTLVMHYTSRSLLNRWQAPVS